MAVWEHLDVSKAHVAYACVGVFSSVFSLVSLFVKERLYIGESTVAAIFGLIVGPVCLNWFNPLTWGNSDSITLEITRIVLCLQIFAVAVELPRKYMLHHWHSVFLLLVPVMTVGWLIIGLFVWILIPGLNFSASLLISACITATDPILAQSVVSGKFAQRVPGHLRNLLSAESGCNDGMAFPFIFLSMNLILHPGDAGEIVKDWICVTLLYECVFGCILGVFIGYVGKRAIKFAEEKNIIDRESFLAFYVVLSFCCAGFGSILGVDDLLVSFAAGTAFAWDGWFTKKTEESKVSTVIDLLLNYAYFIYFGAIIPWSQFNNGDIGCNVWRLVILSIIVIFLRRIPAVMALKPFIPDIKSWREALFVGHFGPIGVGAVFAAILSRGELEASTTEEPTPLKTVPPKGTKHWQLISCVWPITCFFILTSIIVHGSSVAVITLGRHLNSITLTKTFTTHTTNGNGKSSWMQRLPSLDAGGRSFSLHRMDTQAPKQEMSRTNTVETSGIPAKPAGGMRKRKPKTKKKFGKHRKHIAKVQQEFFGTKSRQHSDDELNDLGRERLQHEREARAATFALSSSTQPAYQGTEDEEDYIPPSKFGHVTSDYVQELQDYPVYESDLDEDEDEENDHENRYYQPHSLTPGDQYSYEYEGQSELPSKNSEMSSLDTERKRELEELERTGSKAYVEGRNIIIENEQGEIIDQAELPREARDEEEKIESLHSKNALSPSTSENSVGPNLHALKKILTPTSITKIRSLIDDDNSGKSASSGDSGSSDTHRGKRRRKYHAYKMANQILIENEEGEVVRRYEIHPHDGIKKTADNGPDGVVTKVLNTVGLRRSGPAKNTTEPSDLHTAPPPFQREPQHLTKHHRTLTPAPQNVHISEEEEGEEMRETTEDDTTINSDEDYTTDESENSDEDDTGSDDERESDDSNDSDYGEEDETETEFERQRRLHALGQGPAPMQRDRDDDEEGVPVTPTITATTSTKGTATPRSNKKLKSRITRTFHF